MIIPNMKQFLLAIIFLTIVHSSFAQCTINNATSCQCLTSGSTDCDLLPNIKIAEAPLLVSGSSGVIEYSQTGNGVENGRLRISVSTPNIGRGPLTIFATQTFICGTDTFTSNPGTCSDGSSPRQLIKQRVYHKNGNAMTYYDRPAGSMTYHPTHSHMHVDDWGQYWLRRRDTTEPNPLNWPIVGSGAKLGFCLMDYGSCSTYNGHCRDSADNVLTNSSFPNYGLGGGNYNCSPTTQGISSGYTDIYYQSLDGMYIDIPPTTCNGDYYIVVHIDPHNYFLEENENDNVIAVPYTLTKQLTSGSANISAQGGSTAICEGTALTLSANAGTSYLWSNGDTTQSIVTSQPGQYTVQVLSPCGFATSQPITITEISSHVANVTADAVCEGGDVLLQATGTGSLHWFDAPVAGTLVNSGNSYGFTPTGTTTYFVESRDTLLGITGFVGPVDTSIGSGSYYSNDQHQIFNVYKAIRIKSIKVFANSSKSRVIELRNSSGTVLRKDTVFVSKGMQIIPLDYYIAPGNNYQLGWMIGSSPDLFRNSSGANYPYSFGGLISIIGNSANDLARWYGYYNWEIEEVSTICTSIRVPVTATVNTPPNVLFSGLSTTYFDTDTAVVLTGTPTGGVFSGTGVSGNTFNPADAGVGGPYFVTYQYTDSNGCSGQFETGVSVLHDEQVSVNALLNIKAISLHPNPSNGAFELSLYSTKNVEIDITLTNLLGEFVLAERNIAANGWLHYPIRMQNAAKGIYQLGVNFGSEKKYFRVVVQ